MQIRHCVGASACFYYVPLFITNFFFNNFLFFFFFLLWKEDERKRREKEERIAREEEFLRSSLRGSRKLQALEESCTKSHPAGAAAAAATGVVNIAYTGHDEDDDVANDPGFANAGLAWAALAQNNYLLNSGMQKIVGNLHTRIIVYFLLSWACVFWM